ncbi:MAG TPA: hypothetical protein PKD84_09420 [Propionicimonas sp.]|nr:hypothetical protein [Propionicimonas sp.]
MIRSVVKIGAAFFAVTLAVLLGATPAGATPTIIPQATGKTLDSGNIIVMKPDVAYQVPLAGKISAVKLVQVNTGGVLLDQISVNGLVVRQFSDGDADGQVFLVQVTSTDTLIYQHGLIAEGEFFVHSVVFRFDGSKLVDAMKRDSTGRGRGWFEFDTAYSSMAGAGQIVTKYKGITNTCSYAKSQVSCSAKVPRPKFSGRLKVKRVLSLSAPRVGEYTDPLWYRCKTKSLSSCNGIAINVKKGIAATKPTYRLRRADKGKWIRVCATYQYGHWGDWLCSRRSAAKIK